MVSVHITKGNTKIKKIREDTAYLIEYYGYYPYYQGESLCYREICVFPTITIKHETLLKIIRPVLEDCKKEYEKYRF